MKRKIKQVISVALASFFLISAGAFASGNYEKRDGYGMNGDHGPFMSPKKLDRMAARLERELQLNDSQSKQFAQIIANLKTSRENLNKQHEAISSKDITVPLAIDHMLAMHSTMGTQMNSMGEEIKSFYNSLNASQKAKADAMLKRMHERMDRKSGKHGDHDDHDD